MFVSVEELDRAWIEGRKALIAGISYKSNPFSVETQTKLFNEWANGWLEAWSKYQHDL